MRKVVLILAVMLLQACVTIPDGYISQEEADRQKHAYLCTTNHWMSHKRWDFIPHCVNDSINQQQAVALADWLTRYNGFYISASRGDSTAIKNYHQYYENNYKIIQQLKPYLYAGDYYFYLSDVAGRLWEYYDRDGDDAAQAAMWKKRFEEAKAKQIEVGGGLDGHWARPEYSQEKVNELLINAAKRGNDNAQKILGEYYLEGKRGFKKDVKLGVAWIEESARRNPKWLDLYDLTQLRDYFSDKDYRYWQIMYLLSASKGDSGFDEFDGDLLERLMDEVTDWKHFCDKYQKQRWLIMPEGGIIPEKYEALQTIIVQCITQYPPAEQPYINDIEAD